MACDAPLHNGGCWQAGLEARSHGAGNGSGFWRWVMPRMSSEETLTLALDSTGASCSVALFRGQDLVAVRFEAMERGQAEALLPMIADLFQDAGYRPADLGLIAVGVGPGSFTGLRIALAAAHGLALASGAELVGISSLLAVAAAQPDEAGQVVVAADSKRGDLFCLAPGLWPEPVAVAAEDAAGKLASLGAPLRLAGTGRTMLAEALQALPNPPVWTHASGPDLPRAEDIGRLALERRGLFPPEPLYLRPPDVTLAPKAAGA